MPSIRWRIGLSVLLLVAAFQVAVSCYALARVHSALRQNVDEGLYQYLVALEPLRDNPELAAYVDWVTAHNTRWHEIFFEVRGPDGKRIAASANVPPEGLHVPAGAPRLRARRGEARPWVAHVAELRHPATRAPHHGQIRAAQIEVDGYQVIAAESLKAQRKSYYKLRLQLTWGLFAVALFAAGGAWIVARRSLAPIQAIAEHARRLGASADGTLPRTGSRDELDRLAEVLNGMLGRIRLQVQYLRRMSADAAHALRTPLTLVRGNLEVHMRASGSEEASNLQPTLDALDRTIQLLNRMLLLERLEASQLDSARAREVRLDALAQDLVDTLGIVAHERKIDLHCAAEPVLVRGDPAELGELVLNLLDNALRHTPEGGKIGVSIRASESGEAQLAVHDSGPGLRTDQLERVFERFYSERDGGLGSGLGLTIARAIARGHGGTLTASSPDGARFELILPQV